jgi:hypothetical protein
MIYGFAKTALDQFLYHRRHIREKITINLNGMNTRLEVKPSETLLDPNMEDLGLIGTKDSVARA